MIDLKKLIYLLVGAFLLLIIELFFFTPPFASETTSLILGVFLVLALLVVVLKQQENSNKIEGKLAELKQKSERQLAILSNMKDGVLVLDNEDRIVDINTEAERLLEIEAEAVTGKLIEGVIHSSSLHEVLISESTSELDSAEPIEVKIYHQKEGVKYLQVSRTILQENQDGSSSSLSGAVIVLTDISRLKRLEKIRQDFVANVSHELKTPVTSIIGFVETLLEGALDDPEKAKHFLAIIERQSDRLLSIIEDLLMLAKLESSPSEPDFEEGKVIDGLKRAIQLCHPRATEKQISIYTEADPELRIAADWSLLEQAIVNLVDNAVKYSDTGTKVSVSAETIDQSVAIRVRDEGPGIPEKSLARIFERFYRVDKARSREIGGTGLGLAIVKHVANFHGGSVDVKSSVGEGSEFSVILPRS